MVDYIQAWLENWGLTIGNPELAATMIAVIALLLVASVVNLVARNLLLNLVKKLVAKTKGQWDDALVQQKFFDRLAQVAPAIVIYLLIPDTLGKYELAAGITEKAAILYMLFVATMAVDSLLNAAQQVYRTLAISKSMPITSFLQVIKVTVYALTLILAIAVILGKSPGGILAGLGAMSAVTMLVFKDAILGFVAGLQLSANRMVAAGDWIEVPSRGIDGDVIEVGLTTVKIRNFDNTISTIPTHSLITNTCKNWRGMSESGGRRIKRSISLDMNSVKFCDEAMLARFEKITILKDYLQQKKDDIGEHNSDLSCDRSTLVNGRHLTNLGTFRAYMEAYLRNHSEISKDLTFLVRQLAPTETGVPIEIYVFSTDKRWVQYEAIQADIFDHLLAVAPEFDLRVFQSPTGNDWRAATSNPQN